jgi:hypothetical protein
MTDRSRIDAELDGVRLSPDGSRLVLLLRDAAGEKVSLSLPLSCLSAVLTAAPQPAEPVGAVHSVASWNMTPAENRQDMILTFCTPEGMVTSFTMMKSWQVQGMATVATYGTTRENVGRSVH